MASAMEDEGKHPVGRYEGRGATAAQVQNEGRIADSLPAEFGGLEPGGLEEDLDLFAEVFAHHHD